MGYRMIRLGRACGNTGRTRCAKDRPPQFNGALHLAVILGVGLRLLTGLLPGLRALLGLDPLTLELLTLVSAAVLMTWGAAEAYSRLALSAHCIQEVAT